MIDFERYTERFGTAQEQKDSSKFRDKIFEELKRVEWIERKAELDKSLSNIKDENDFQKYQRNLEKLFDDIFEVITAPGVDAFVNWLNDLTDNKNEGNTKKLRKFLVDNYADYSESVDSIIDNRKAIEVPINSIFSRLLSKARDAMKKDCNTFLDKPAEFENNIDDFLGKLDDNLTKLNNIEELAYSDIEELYSEEQKNNNIDFYSDIISKIVEENQSLKPISDPEKNDSWLDKLNARIADIKNCIKQLDKTALAKNTDETVKDMFLSFKDDMIKFEKGISHNLEEFLSQKWEDIITHYDTIKSFFDEKKEIVEEDDWKSFKAKDEITVLILKYNSIKKENPLSSLKSKSLLSIQQTLTKKFKEINDYEEEAKKTKQAILNAFYVTVTEYSDKLDLIEKLDTNKSLFNQIKEDGIDVLDRVCKSLSNQDVIGYLKDEFSDDLRTYNNIKNWFNEVLQKSGMKTKIDWLEEQLQSEDSCDISENNLDVEVLKELLSNKLIALTITKTF